MRLKQGVSTRGASPEILAVIPIVESIYELAGVPWYLRVITSCVEGLHHDGSDHYKGDSIDFRVWAFHDEKYKWISRRKILDEFNDNMPADIGPNSSAEPAEHFAHIIRISLGTDYQVVLKKDHCHVEFDPQRPLNEDGV